MHYRYLVLLPVGLFIVIAASCSSREEIACKVDTDCAPGNICREQVCGPVSSDASVASETSAPTCVSEGATCTSPDDCCSRNCTSNQCVATNAPPVNPTCRGSLELCQNDCCPNLACVAGVCR